MKIQKSQTSVLVSLVFAASVAAPVLAADPPRDETNGREKARGEYSKVIDQLAELTDEKISQFANANKIAAEDYWEAKQRADANVFDGQAFIDMQIKKKFWESVQKTYHRAATDKQRLEERKAVLEKEHGLAVKVEQDLTDHPRAIRGNSEDRVDPNRPNKALDQLKQRENLLAPFGSRDVPPIQGPRGAGADLPLETQAHAGQQAWDNGKPVDQTPLIPESLLEWARDLGDRIRDHNICMPGPSASDEAIDDYNDEAEDLRSEQGRLREALRPYLN